MDLAKFYLPGFMAGFKKSINTPSLDLKRFLNQYESFF